MLALVQIKSSRDKKTWARSRPHAPSPRLECTTVSHGGYQGTCWVPFQGYRRPCFHRVGKGMSLHQIPYQVHFHIDRSLRSETVRQGTVTTYKGNFSRFSWIINYYCSASHFCFGCIPFSQSCLRSSHCCAFIFLSQLSLLLSLIVSFILRFLHQTVRPRSWRDFLVH